MTMITAKFVDPPQDADQAAGIKGRKSWRITDQNGNKYFARADAGRPKELQDLSVQIKKGGTYEVEANSDKNGNNWINDAKEGEAPASAPAPEAGPAASSWVAQTPEGHGLLYASLLSKPVLHRMARRNRPTDG